MRSVDDKYRILLSNSTVGGPSKRAGAVLERELEDGVLLLDLEAGRIHQLNLTAGFVWRRCDGATMPGSIAESLAREYEVEVAVAVADVDMTLGKLRALNLVEDSEAQAQGTQGPSVA